MSEIVCAANSLPTTLLSGWIAAEPEYYKSRRQGLLLP